MKIPLFQPIQKFFTPLVFQNDLALENRIHTHPHTHIFQDNFIHNRTTIPSSCSKIRNGKCQSNFPSSLVPISWVRMWRNITNKLRKIDCDLDFFSQRELIICPTNSLYWKNYFLGQFFSLKLMLDNNNQNGLNGNGAFFNVVFWIVRHDPWHICRTNVISRKKLAQEMIFSLWGIGRTYD